MKKRGFVEALGRGGGHNDFPKGRRFIKRQTAKLIRRLGRLMLDDTPIRVTRGWAD